MMRKPAGVASQVPARRRRVTAAGIARASASAAEKPATGAGAAATGAAAANARTPRWSQLMGPPAPPARPRSALADHALAGLAQALDTELDDVALAQEARRLHEAAH